MESGAEPSRAGTVHASRIIGCLLSAPALNNIVDCAPEGEQHSIRMLPVVVDRNCTGHAPKIVVQSREKWPNPSPSIRGMDCQIKRLDEENGESQTACHLLT
jgi:hypothetical protein